MSGPDRSGTLVMAALSAFLSSSVWQLGRFGQMIAAPGATRIGEERVIAGSHRPVVADPTWMKLKVVSPRMWEPNLC
jgi:hypothetical protein